MKKTLFTVRELSSPDQLDRSPLWLRRAIQHKKIKAEKIGNTYVVKADEVERTKNNMPKLSFEEMHGRTRKE